VQIEACRCNQCAERPFDFSSIPNPTRRAGFCDLHGAILRRSLWERKPFVSENDNRANALVWRYLTERLWRVERNQEIVAGDLLPEFGEQISVFGRRLPSR
jgi:hypothetical protein